MRALVFDRPGDPGEVLRLAEIAAPCPGKGEALIKVTVRPIHPADLAFIRGQYRIRPNSPQVAGLEGAGVVLESSGPGAIAAGTRVAFRWPGTWADIAAIPFHRLIEVPNEIPDAAACQISLNPVTAWALLDQVQASGGDWLLLTAGTSTVSNLLSAMARRRGLRVIALVRGDAVQAAGRVVADLVLSLQDPDIGAAIKTAAGGQQVAALLDSVGGPILPKLFATLRPGAQIVAYGVQERTPAPVSNAMLIYSNLTWMGFGIDRWLAGLSADATDRMFRELWALVADGTLPLRVASTHKLDAFGEALVADARPGRAGKVLLA